MALAEKEYNELYKYSLDVASKYVGYRDAAYDIAQNALLALISTKTPVESPFAWLKTTVRREATKFLKEEDRIHGLAVQSKLEPSVSRQQRIEDDENALLLNVDPQKIYYILSKEDYQIFKNFKAVGFATQKYADKYKVSFDTANTHKKRIKRNIQAAVLVQDGWRHTTKVLSYSQYYTINRFIKQIFTSKKSNKMGELRNYLKKVDKEKFEEAFANTEDCHEWGIRMEDDSYILTIVCTPLKPVPTFVIVTVDFNKTNYLNVTAVKEVKPIMIIENASLSVLQKYKKKGVIDLTTEQSVAILTNKKTDI